MGMGISLGGVAFLAMTQSSDRSIASKGKSGTGTQVPWNLEISLGKLQVVVLPFVNHFMELSPISRITSFLQNWHFERL